MNICSHCGKEIESLPFKCRYCKLYHCPDCRVPETHKCSMLAEHKSRWHNSFKKNINELVGAHCKIYDRGCEVIVDRHDNKQTTIKNESNAPPRGKKKYKTEKPFDKINQRTPCLKLSVSLSNRIKRFWDWLNERPYNSRYNVNFITSSSVFVVLSAAVFFMFYAYMHEINKIVDGYFIGSILLVFSGVSLSYLIVDLFKNIRLWFNYTKRWKRYILIVALFILIPYAAQQDTVIFESAGELYNKMLVMTSSMVDVQSSLESTSNEINNPLRPQTKEEYKASSLKDNEYNIASDLNPTKNIFVGKWRLGGGSDFVFRNGGTGTISYDMLIDYRAQLPFTYEYNGKKITITSIDAVSGELSNDIYNYELDGNILKLEYEENGKIVYLMKQ